MFVDWTVDELERRLIGEASCTHHAYPRDCVFMNINLSDQAKHQLASITGKSRISTCILAARQPSGAAIRRAVPRPERQFAFYEGPR